MSQDDDDIGGGTLVMNPEDRPRIPTAGQRTPGAFATEQVASIDDSWGDDATDDPGTFIMNVDQHAQQNNPASPFAEASKERGNWPAAPPVGQVVVGPAAAAPDPKLAHAQTLIGGTFITAEAEALIQQHIAAGPPAGGPAFGAPPMAAATLPSNATEAGQPSYPHIDPRQPSYPNIDPSYPNVEPRMMASYPTVDPGHVPFPPPGAYPTEQALRAATAACGRTSSGRSWQ